MADGYVQVAPDSTGKKIDNSELTRADGTVVERQRVVLGDDLDPKQQSIVLDGALRISQSLVDRRIMEALLLEAIEQDYRLLGANERYDSDRRGYEIR